ncbi:sugar ABC transporter permease [Streptobacillus felis]|uniref:Sugar ABC transporter permease n=2 Tax=Streptobacillus felis TaxID=1384509 RepID=A0A7Z0PFT2_9FUSO|nr:sugar ABC transporter permease [Streptobacillus felis]NYV27918.1 sugar ABC transporter permease [Streptobacillus felis]
MILYIMFRIIPTFQVFRMSLFKTSALSRNPQFVGLNNFKILFNDPKFIKTFQNTILLIVVVTVVTLTIAVIFAAILATEKIKGANLFRIIFYIPNILSIVVVSGIFAAIYDPGRGLIDSILIMFRIKPPQFGWLGDQSIVIYSIAFALIWQAIGYYMVMYMAAMSAIPESLYEAADIDGAGKITKFFRITLPLVWLNIRATLAFFIISTINLSFLLVIPLTGGGPDGATEVFLSYMYSQAYTNQSYGYGMAIGVIVFIFSFALSGIINVVTDRDILQY